MSTPYASEAFLNQIIGKALIANATDIYLEVGQPPGARVLGEIVRFRFDRIEPGDTEAAAVLLMGPGVTEMSGERVGTYTSPDHGRLRVCAYRAQGALGLILRPIPAKIPSLAALGVPVAGASVIDQPQGLVVIAGGVRSGKTTTAAAMLNQLNENVSKHIITVEAPVEFLHAPKKCSIGQREVGRDTATFHAGAVAAISQAPDVLYLSDLGAADCLGVAIEAAELGMLVVGVLRSPSAARAILTLTSGGRDGLRERVMEVLSGIVAQRLVPKRDATGHVLASEVLVATDAVRDVIGHRTGHSETEAAIEALMASGASPFGMQTFEGSLKALSAQGLISKSLASQ